VYKYAVDARSRLALCVAAGLVASVPTVLFTPWQVAVLVGWDVTALFFVTMVWLRTRNKDSAATRVHATREDDSRIAADAILVGASVASLVGVVFALIEAAGSEGAAHTGIAAVAVLSVVLSWASVHAVFTLRYARLFYTDRGGIDFHAGGYMPTYGDFLYVALTIGMTFQVSDTDLTGIAIRRSAIRHALLSYLFGVVVVAITINVVASLLTK
jgi:uncharacterized membrane protein